MSNTNDRIFTEDFFNTIAAKTAEMLSETIQAHGQPRLMNTARAAEYLGQTSEGSLRQRRFQGQIPDNLTVKIGGRVYYDRTKIDDWLDSKAA